MTRPDTTRLSATDAFFVAYQESSGVLMQLGVEVELKGRIERRDVEQALEHIVRRWPPLGQRLHKDLLGLSWAGECRTREMLRVAGGREALAEWRNRPLNPFAEPPFQLLWIGNGGGENLLAFRAHHAVVDGEGFFAVCVEAVRRLVSFETRDSQAERRSFPDVPMTEALRNLQQLRSQARLNQSARLAIRSAAPGDTSIVERDLERDELRELKQQAKASGVAPGWLCASAWMRAIHAWNREREPGSTPLISIEVPVSLRRRRDGIRIGNWISPIALYGDATLPTEALATELKRQMSAAMRRRTHLALPLLSAPVKFIPWGLFRKLVASPELTGFATSHFAWFEQSGAIHDEVLQGSNGALQIVDQRIYTPVCLHMGAAMAVLAWPERAQIFITHRRTALTTADANALADLVMQELGQQCLNRQRVAV